MNKFLLIIAHVFAACLIAAVFALLDKLQEYKYRYQISEDIKQSLKRQRNNIQREKDAADAELRRTSEQLAYKSPKEIKGMAKEVDTLIVNEDDLLDEVKSACILGYEARVKLSETESVYADNPHEPFETYRCYVLHLLKDDNE